MQENKQTHQILHRMEERLDSFSAVQAIHTASLNTMTQVNAAAPRSITNNAGHKNTAPPPAPPHQLYSSVAKTSTPPGPADPPPANKAKRKASDGKPAPIDYASMLHQDLLFALQDREKPGFNKALNPLPTYWNKAPPQDTDKPATKACQPSKPKLPKVITLPAVQRRFHATRTKAEPFEDTATFVASLPLTLARTLDSVHSEVDKAFTVSINPNGTVSVLAALSSPAVDYVNFFTLLTNTLNAKLPVGDNPFNSFNLVPTTADYAIHNLPVHVLPSNPA
jgi:hypothetical protein